jgi:hypothetical protein
MHRVRLTGSLIVAVALILFTATVAAEHEADHSYNVRGYVLSPDKQALGGTPVTIRMDGEIIGSGRTDGEGYYAIRLHLHDSDIDRLLVVRAGEHQAQVRVQAEYGNRRTPRVHHVNFVGGELSEENLSGTSIPVWVYVAAAPLVLWGALSLSGVMRRKVRKLQLAKVAEEPASGKKRRGKRRR